MKNSLKTLLVLSLVLGLSSLNTQAAVAARGSSVRSGSFSRPTAKPAPAPAPAPRVAPAPAPAPAPVIREVPRPTQAVPVPAPIRVTPSPVPVAPARVVPTPTPASAPAPAPVLIQPSQPVQPVQPTQPTRPPVLVAPVVIPVAPDIPSEPNITAPPNHNTYRNYNNSSPSQIHTGSDADFSGVSKLFIAALQVLTAAAIGVGIGALGYYVFKSSRNRWEAYKEENKKAHVLSVTVATLATIELQDFARRHSYEANSDEVSSVVWAIQETALYLIRGRDHLSGCKAICKKVDFNRADAVFEEISVIERARADEEDSYTSDNGFTTKNNRPAKEDTEPGRYYSINILLGLYDRPGIELPDTEINSVEDLIKVLTFIKTLSMDEIAVAQLTAIPSEGGPMSEDYFMQHFADLVRL